MVLFCFLLLVAGGVRNIHDNNVSGQLSNSSNHNVRQGSDEEYMNIAHKLENEVIRRMRISPTRRYRMLAIQSDDKCLVFQQENDSSMRAAAFPAKSPQSLCSPAGSEEITESMLP